MQRLVQFALMFTALLLAAACSLVSGPADEPPPDTPAAPTSTPLPDTGMIVINVATEPDDQPGVFQFTGVPSGTISADNTLVVADLAPGTYTTTQVDPAPDFDLTAIACEDSTDGTASSGDPSTRTAVINLDAGETVTCRFTNSQRGSLVVRSVTEPGGAGGQFQFTGVPSGTIPADGTLVVANLQPGTYTTTEVDPAPQFDLTAVTCDDDGSATASSGDPTSRSAIFSLDPGEMITCTFVNTRRGAAVVAVETEPASADGAFQFTGVPSGTVAAMGTLIVADLSPGTYTTTAVDPAPDFELTEVTCDDGTGGVASSGDASTRSAIFNVDAGETVTCVFRFESTNDDQPGGGAGGGDTGSGGEDAVTPGGDNPFVNPDPLWPNFPLPDELPDDAGSAGVPKAGPWTAYNFEGQMSCDGFGLPLPAQPPEGGTLEVLDGGDTLIGRGVSGEGADVPITMSADLTILGRYTGSLQVIEEGIPVSINFYWQVVTDEYIVGYLDSAVTAEGTTCTVYRPFELRYAGG